MRKVFSQYLFILLAALFAVMLPAAATLAAEPVLTITGTGLQKDVLIYQNDWNRYTKTVRYYSTCNAQDFHKIWKVEGYDLVALLGGPKGDNLESGNQKIAFYAKGEDEPLITKCLWDLNGRYYYPHFDTKDKNAKGVAAMIGLRRIDLYEHHGLPDPADVVWSEQAVKVDDRAPRIYFGQTKGNVSDTNQSGFIYNLVRIVVGGERSADGDEQSGGASQGSSDPSSKVDEKAPSAGTASKTDGDKKVATGTDEKKDDERVDNSGESSQDDGGDESKADEGAAAGDDIGAPEPGDDVENPEITETGAESGKAHWIWIVVGAILIGGLVGRGLYNYLKRRKET